MTKQIDHAVEFMKNFKMFLKDSIKPDAILTIEDKEFPVHRIILAAQSPFFFQLLCTSSFSEADAKKIPLQAPIEAFELMLNYFYTGIFDLEGIELEDLLEILELSRRYLLPRLEADLVEAIIAMVNMENIVLIIKTADILDLNKLKEKYYEVISQNCQEFIECEYYLNLNQREFLEIFNGETVPLSIIEKFQVVSKWIEANSGCDKDKILDTLIDLSRLSLRQIINIVAPTKLYDAEKLLALSAREHDVIEESVTLSIHLRNLSVKIGKNAENLTSKTSFLRAEEIDHFCEIVLDLGFFAIINCLKFNLGDSSSSFTIYTSTAETFPEGNNINLIHWTVSKRLSWCHRYQTVYFSSVKTKLIRIQGVQKINNFQALYVTSLPDVDNNGYNCPSSNILTPEHCFLSYASSDNMLRWDFIEKGVETPFTESLPVPFGTIVVVLNQPCFLTKCRIRLWDFDGNTTRFYLETKDITGKTNIALNDVHYFGWLSFNLIPKVYKTFKFLSTTQSIKIVHFEASA